MLAGGYAAGAGLGWLVHEVPRLRVQRKVCCTCSVCKAVAALCLLWQTKVLCNSLREETASSCWGLLWARTYRRFLCWLSPRLAAVAQSQTARVPLSSSWVGTDRGSGRASSSASPWHPMLCPGEHIGQLCGRLPFTSLPVYTWLPQTSDMGDLY